MTENADSWAELGRAAVSMTSPLRRVVLDDGVIEADVTVFADEVGLLVEFVDKVATHRAAASAGGSQASGAGEHVGEVDAQRSATSSCTRCGHAVEFHGTRGGGECQAGEGEGGPCSCPYLSGRAWPGV